MSKVFIFIFFSFSFSFAYCSQEPSLSFQNKIISSDGEKIAIQGPERGEVILKNKSKTDPYVEWELHLGETAVGQYRDWSFPLTCTRLEETGAPGTCLFYISLSGSPDYSMVSDNCSGITQAFNQTCVTTVRFAPTAMRSSRVIYTIDDYTIPGSLYSINFRVSGSGLAHPNQCPKTVSGSLISVDGRSVSEEIPIVGTDFSVHYSSSFDSSYQSIEQEGLPPGVQFNRQGWNPSIYHFYSWAQQRVFKGSGMLTNSASTPTNLVSHRVVSADETEIYTFSWEGLHLETRTFLTGAVRYQFSHDSAGRLTKITDAFGKETNFTYDPSGDLTTIVSPYGHITTFTTGNNGKFSTITNPKSETYSMTYNSSGGLYTFTKPGGQVTTLTYDYQGKLLKDLGNGGNFWELMEGVSGQISKVSQMGRTSSFATSHSNGGIERSAIYPSGEWEYYSENKYGGAWYGSPQLETSRTSVPDTRFMNTHRNISSTKLKINGIEVVTNHAVATDATPSAPFSFTYFNRSKTRNGKVFTSSLNKSTMTLTNSSPEGVTTQVVLNANEQPVSFKFGNDSLVSYTYDSYGRVTSVKEGISHNQVTYAYNSAGFVKSITNALNQATSYVYDLAGRVTNITLPNSNVIQYSYDSNGNVTSITPPSRPAHAFTFNAMELNEQYQPPVLSGVLNVNTQYAYNLDKQLTQITNPSGETVVFNYNNTTGLLSNIAVSGGTHYYSYQTNTDLVSRIDARDGIRSNYTYYGRMLASEEQRWAANDFMFGKVSHEFDAEHRLSQRVVQGNSLTYALTVTIDYNNDDIPTRIGNLHYSYTYPSGRLQNTTIENISDSRIYDSYGNLAEYAAYYNPTSGSPQLLYSYVLTRDVLNRITTKVETIQGVTTTYNYTYDILGRLSTVHRNGLPYSCYFYDANGNRINGVINGVPFTATYDNQDRVLTYAGKTYTHTADGYVDLVTYPDATTQQYVFDTLGNFRTVKLRNNQTEFYQHDGQYRLVSLFLGSTLQYRRIYAENDRIVGRVNNSGVLSESYVYGARNTPEYFYKNSGQYRLITDHLGSVRLVVNTANGTVAQRMDYNEWGDVLNDTSPGFQPYGYAGGLYLPASRIVKFGARIYDPSIGRWLLKDPILFKGGDASLYGYVLGDPINFIDQDGMSRKLMGPNTLEGAGGGVGGGAGGSISIGSILSAISSSLPWRGPPGGTIVRPNPKNPNEKSQERTYDKDGKPLKDIDYGHDHGQGCPHEHEWTQDENGKPVRGPGKPLGTGSVK